jgi:hypothetical protein
MPDTESYDLIAYDIDTKKEVFKWRNVSVKPGVVYGAGSTINNDPERWLVVGVRTTSTARLKHVDVRRVPRFKLRECVKKIGMQETRTVEEIREGSGEPLYSIQLGSDFATRIWAKESELEAAETGTTVMDSETGKTRTVKPGDFI